MASTSFTILLKDRLSGGLSKIGQMGSKTFGKLDRLQNRVNEKLSKGAANAGKLANKMSLVNQRGQRSNAIFSKLGGVLAGIVAFGGISSLASGVVETTAKFEKFDAVLTNTLGSKTEATKNMQLIQDFASKTPFGIDELTGSFVKLTNRGLQPNVKQMTQLGDLASSVGKSYDQLTEAMLDAVTGEFERLKEFGIKANKQGNQVKFTFKGVTKTVGFTEKAMRDYILSLGDLKGVQGSMAAISETLGGKISNLKDKYVTFQKTLGEALRPVMIKVIGSMGKMLEFGERLIKWFSKNQKYILPFVKGIGLAVVAMVAFQTISYLVSLVNPFGLIMAGVTLLISGLVYLYNNFAGFHSMVNGVVSSLRGPVMELRNSFGALFESIGNLFSSDTNSKAFGFMQVVTKVFGFVFKAAAFNMKIWMKLLSVFARVTNGIVSAINYMKPHILGLWERMEGFRNAMWGLWDAFKKIFNWLVDKVKSAFGFIGRLITKVLEKLGFGDSDGIGKAFLSGLKKDPVSNDKQETGKGGLFSGISNTVNSLSQAGNTPGLAAIAGIAGVTGGAASRNITINIDTLAKIEYRNQTVKESASNLTEQIKQVLLTAVNDVNLVQ